VQSIQIQGQRQRNAAGKQTLSGDELRSLPGSSGDPMKAVQSLPGITSVDDSSSDPAVRGARPQDNLYYVDFLPVGYLFHLGGFTSVFNPDLIRRFDLTTAAWSPEYGDAVGAVFDISLRNPRSDRIGGKVDFSLLGANGLVEGPLSDSVSFFLAARRSWFDLVVKNGEDKEEGVSYTIPVYSDSQGRLLWTLNRSNSLRLDFSTANDRIDFTVKPDAKAGQRDPALIGNSSDRQSYRTAAVSWDADFGGQTNNRFAVGQTTRKDFFRLGSAGRLDANVTTTYVREQLQWQATPAQTLTVGASANSRLVDVDLDFQDPRCTEFNPNCDISSAARVLTRQETRQNQADVYASHRWQFVPGWTASTGLRATRDAYFEQTSVEPRLGLEWQASPRTLVSLGAGRHNQPPPLEQALRGVGNPNLAPLRSNHGVLGVTQTFDAGWSVRTEVYGKTFKGYAVDDPLLNYRNGASGTARGLEMLLKKDPAKDAAEDSVLRKLSGFLSLSVSRARRRNDTTGETFPFDYDQPVVASLVGQYKQSDRWQYGAKWSYHTGSPYTPVVGTGTYPDGRVRPLYGAINSQRVPVYHRLDLRVDWKRSPTFTAYGELINAYGRKNVAGYSYSADYQTREPVYQLPVLISFGVQYGF
jgi:hypothetical protein